MKDKLNLMDLLHLAYRWMYLLIVVSLLGGILGFSYSYFLVDPVYISQGNLYVSAVTAEYMEEEMESVPISILSASASLAADYVEIIEYDSILEKAAALCDTEITTQQMAAMIKASVVAEDSMLINLTVTAKEPYLAYDVANAVLTVAAEQLPLVAKVKGVVTIVEQARTPTYSKTSPVVHCVFGFICGLFIGVLLMLLFELMDNRIKQTDDIVAKYNMPVIGVVPNIRGSHEPKE